MLDEANQNAVADSEKLLNVTDHQSAHRSQRPGSEDEQQIVMNNDEELEKQFFGGGGGPGNSNGDNNPDLIVTVSSY